MANKWAEKNREIACFFKETNTKKMGDIINERRWRELRWKLIKQNMICGGKGNC